MPPISTQIQHFFSLQNHQKKKRNHSAISIQQNFPKRWK